jgi:hypothetical protein
MTDDTQLHKCLKEKEPALAHLDDVAKRPGEVAPDERQLRGPLRPVLRVLGPLRGRAQRAPAGLTMTDLRGILNLWPRGKPRQQARASNAPPCLLLLHHREGLAPGEKYPEPVRKRRWRPALTCGTHPL